MTASPKKNICNFVRSTHNQGVEVREHQTTNLDSSDLLKLNIGSVTNEMVPSPELLDDDISTMSNSTSALCSQDNSSYIQVVVKKHQSKKNEDQRQAKVLQQGIQHVASQTSPARTVNPAPSARKATKTACEYAEVPQSQAEVLDATSTARPTLYVLPHHMLFTCPPTHQCTCQYRTKVDAGNSARSSSAFKKMIMKDFPQRSTQHELPEQHVSSSHCADQIARGSKQWLHDTLSKFTLGAFQQPEPGMDKVEVYMLDHGSREYYSTTDRAPLTLADGLAERADTLATRFWAELFGLPHLVLAFFTAFILQLLRSVLSGAVRPLLVGSLQTTSDYLLKPALAVSFNALLQPPLLLLLNVLASVRDALAPLADTLSNLLNPLTTVIGSLRLVHVTYNTDKCKHNV